MAALLSTDCPGLKRISVWLEGGTGRYCHDLLDGGQPGGLLGGSLLRRIGAVARVDRMLVGFIRFAGSQLDALLGARIDVLDHLRVRRGQFVELVHAIPDRRGLPLHVLLAGEGIYLAPEAFMRIGLQRIFSGGGVGLSGSRSSGGSRALILRGGGVLGKGRNREGAGQKQCNQ